MTYGMQAAKSFCPTDLGVFVKFILGTKGNFIDALKDFFRAEIGFLLLQLKNNKQKRKIMSSATTVQCHLTSKICIFESSLRCKISYIDANK
ncbi:hypothetical protein BBI01_18180 [Chryseobacterium artocarpi]|uniref:Uncharacterized protein n=1 Tax=Chryseobacterium artocarpi TaxID=1414727 RepID=A0A1B8ZC30_9FLAO|nr:hypothetical protein BBI01_18180 [Chryseobacterium artocarpi]